MKIGIDLDDVMAVCAVPYLRKFAEEYRVELPDEREIGWHLLRDMDPYVAPEERDRFRIKLYDGRHIHPTRIWEDRETDIALLAVDSKGLVPARPSGVRQPRPPAGAGCIPG